jgi:hypothetical protein
MCYGCEYCGICDKRTGKKVRNVFNKTRDIHMCDFCCDELCQKHFDTATRIFGTVDGKDIKVQACMGCYENYYDSLLSAAKVAVEMDEELDEKGVICDRELLPNDWEESVYPDYAVKCTCGNCSTSTKNR